MHRLALGEVRSELAGPQKHIDLREAILSVIAVRNIGDQRGMKRPADHPGVSALDL